MTTHLDLCSGIGGFALAARWHGIQTIGFCEIDPWCRRVLAKNFPGVPQHDDLTTLGGGTVRGWVQDRGVVLNAAILAGKQRNERRQLGDTARGSTSARDGRVEELSLLTAGYPCQPFSLAGKRLGAEDDRHLWPYIAALVDDLRPTWCLFENVAGHITLGLDRVLSDLEEIGYTTRAVVVPACAVGAPHRRDRVWIMAHAERSGRREQLQTDAAQGALSETQWRESAPWLGSGGTALADAASIREREPADEADTFAVERHAWAVVGGGSRDLVALHANGTGRREQRWAVADEPQYATAERGGGREVEPGLGEPFDGLSGWMDERLARPWDGGWEDGVPRVTDGCPDRTHKLKALGNSIVPQVAYVLMAAMFADGHASQPERRAS